MDGEAFANTTSREKEDTNDTRRAWHGRVAYHVAVVMCGSVFCAPRVRPPVFAGYLAATVQPRWRRASLQPSLAQGPAEAGEAPET